MSVNVINLSGQLNNVFYSPAGKQLPSGAVLRYPDLTIVGSFQNVPVQMGDHQVVIGSQDIRIKVSLGKESDAQGKLIESKFQQGCRWFLVSNGTFVNWTNKQGQTVSEIKVSFGDLRVGQRMLANLNHSVIQGKVVSQQGPWMQVEERYRNPSEPDPSKAWKSRYIPVFYWTPPDRPLENLMDQQVLVIGRLSMHSPVLQEDRTYKMSPFLHVIASEVHACLG